MWVIMLFHASIIFGISLFVPTNAVSCKDRYWGNFRRSCDIRQRCANPLSCSDCASGYLELPLCSKENIAMNKATIQSSTYGTQSASNAVDRDINTCSRTKEDQDTWWQVDFGEISHLRWMNVTLDSSFKTAVTRFYASNVSYSKRKYKLPQEHTLICNVNTPNSSFVSCVSSCRGRYVIVVVNSIQKRSLGLCEITIIACSDIFHGDKCQQRCYCRNESERCDETYGKCVSGCTFGYEGSACTALFAPTLYEIESKHTSLQLDDDYFMNIYLQGLSHHNKLTERRSVSNSNSLTFCDNANEPPGPITSVTVTLFRDHSSTGKTDIDSSYAILRDVTAGRSYRICHKGREHCYWNAINKYLLRLRILIQSYQNGFFMGNDSQSGICVDCTDGCRPYCDTRTGVCTRGCIPGKEGKRCGYCRDRKFGFYCTKTCHCFDPNESCNKTTGFCMTGCSEDYIGSSCQECKDGKFSINCAETCNCRNSIKVRGKSAGFCLSGCKIQYFSPSFKKGRFSTSNASIFRASTTKIYTIPRRSITRILSSSPDATGTLSLTPNAETNQTAMNCTIGRFGELCALSCNCKNQSEQCHPIKGTCLSGCISGYTGDSCGDMVDALPMDVVVSVTLLGLSVVFAVFLVYRYLNRKHRKSHEDNLAIIQTLKSSNMYQDEKRKQNQNRTPSHRGSAEIINSVWLNVINTMRDKGNDVHNTTLKTSPSRTDCDPGRRIRSKLSDTTFNILLSQYRERKEHPGSSKDTLASKDDMEKSHLPNQERVLSRHERRRQKYNKALHGSESPEKRVVKKPQGDTKSLRKGTSNKHSQLSLFSSANTSVKSTGKRDSERNSKAHFDHITHQDIQNYRDKLPSKTRASIGQVLPLDEASIPVFNYYQSRTTNDNQKRYGSDSSRSTGNLSVTSHTTDAQFDKYFRNLLANWKVRSCSD